jgi:hypothetical protein
MVDQGFLAYRPYGDGARELSPGSLRARRLDDGRVMVARLSARTHEYETERGLWGRTGGVFAHVVILDAEEVKAVGGWLAGLWESPAWRVSDPEPTRGRAPEAWNIGSEGSRMRRGVQEVRRLLSRVQFRAGGVAGALGVIAAAVRGESGPLVVAGLGVDAASVIAGLTLAFPAMHRCEIGFSTDHHRPEELPGLHVQGTRGGAAARRAAARLSGRVLDLETGELEGEARVPRWAERLAEWALGGNAGAWERLEQTVAGLKPPHEARVTWTDRWLDSLTGWVEEQVNHGRTTGPGQWSDWLDRLEWIRESGQAGAWLADHGPAWWSSLMGARGSEAGFLEVLQAVLKLPEAWRPVAYAQGRAWGQVVGSWMAQRSEGARHAGLLRCLEHVPREAGSGFLSAVAAPLPLPAIVALEDWLREVVKLEERILQPVVARRICRQAGTVGRVECLAAIRRVLIEALERPRSLRAVLDVLEQESRRPGGLSVAEVSRVLAESLALRKDEPGSRIEGAILSWGLSGSLERAEAWLGTWLLYRLRRLDDPEAWRAFRHAAPEEGRGRLTRVSLGLFEQARNHLTYRRIVEYWLLRLPPAQRPQEARWVERYLECCDSDVGLVERLYVRERRVAGLRGWVEAARRRGALAHVHEGRLERLRAYARRLSAGSAAGLTPAALPVATPAERPIVLEHLMRCVGRRSEAHLATCLETVQQAWPGAFDRGSAELEGLALPLSQVLISGVGDAQGWVLRLREVVEALKSRGGWGPSGLGAWVVAWTVRHPRGAASGWRLRQSLFEDRTTYRMLDRDLAGDLMVREAGAIRAIAREWDRRIEKRGETARFFELVLNAAPGAALGALIEEFRGDLRTVGRLSWWEAQDHGGAADDVRERVARLAPVPLEDGSQARALVGWLRGEGGQIGPTFALDGLGIEETRGRLQDALDLATGKLAGPSGLSSEACERVRILHLTSLLRDPELGSAGPGRVVQELLAHTPIRRSMKREDAEAFANVLRASASGLGKGLQERLERWLAQCVVGGGAVSGTGAVQAKGRG